MTRKRLVLAQRDEALLREYAQTFQFTDFRKIVNHWVAVHDDTVTAPETDDSETDERRVQLAQLQNGMWHLDAGTGLAHTRNMNYVSTVTRDMLLCDCVMSVVHIKPTGEPFEVGTPTSSIPKRIDEQYKPAITVVGIPDATGPFDGPTFITSNTVTMAAPTNSATSCHCADSTTDTPIVRV
jgi:hypothetical protein